MPRIISGGGTSDQPSFGRALGAGDGRRSPARFSGYLVAAETLLLSRIMVRSKRSLRIFGAVLAAAVVAALGYSLGRASRSDTASPAIHEGTVAMVDIDGGAFFVVQQGASAPQGYPTPTLWMDAQGGVHQGDRPACLQPLSKGQHITYGVVRVDPVQGAAGSILAAWVKCD
jgi:hypothetical protein